MLLDTEKYLKALFQLAISVVILFGAATYSFAQTQPRLINFQGKLTDQQWTERGQIYFL